MNKKVMDKKFSKEICKKNKVNIESFLNSIHVFHEVIDEEYNMAGHPYLTLFPDGSGHVNPPIQFSAIKDKNGNIIYSKPLYSFRSLKELLKKADELCGKYNIVWDNY